MYEDSALGMIETWGLTALIAAGDAAAKAANVIVKTMEKADAGIVTIYILGDVASVKAAVDAGQEEAKRIGKLLSAHVIPRPDSSVKKIIQNLLEPESSDWLNKSVQELRRIARSLDNFPYAGREISKLTKQELVTLLQEHQKERK